MFALMTRYYAGMRYDAFNADLDEKTWVIQLLDNATGAVRGFSTQCLIQVERSGRKMTALYSGDTIVDRACWSSNLLAQVWGRFALNLMEQFAFGELYWFLISKGFRTYRFLPVFFHEFYPRRETPTPAWAKEALDTLARSKFGEAYDDATGIVRAVAGQCRLRPGVGEVTQARASNADVEFFERRNPGHARGDELCCLAPLTPENFTAAAYRTIGYAPRAQEIGN
jgi:hypothetical protein